MRMCTSASNMFCFGVFSFWKVGRGRRHILQTGYARRKNFFFQCHAHMSDWKHSEVIPFSAAFQVAFVNCCSHLRRNEAIFIQCALPASPNSYPWSCHLCTHSAQVQQMAKKYTFGLNCGLRFQIGWNLVFLKKLQIRYALWLTSCVHSLTALKELLTFLQNVAR